MLSIIMSNSYNILQQFLASSPSMTINSLSVLMEVSSKGIKKASFHMFPHSWGCGLKKKR